MARSLVLLGFMLSLGMIAAHPPGQVAEPESNLKPQEKYTKGAEVMDQIVDILVHIDPKLAYEVMSENFTDISLPDQETGSLAEDTENNVTRAARAAAGGGGLAIMLPRNADETSLLKLGLLKGVPKQLTMTVIRVNNLLSALGLARNLFLVDSRTYVDLVDCIAPCCGDPVCIAAAKKCDPASLHYMQCMDAASLLKDPKLCTNNPYPDPYPTSYPPIFPPVFPPVYPPIVNPPLPDPTPSIPTYPPIFPPIFPPIPIYKRAASPYNYHAQPAQRGPVRQQAYRG